MEGARIPQLHPLFPQNGEGMVPRRGRGGGIPFRQNNGVLREVSLEFGHPPMMPDNLDNSVRLRSNSFNGHMGPNPHPQHNRLENGMQNYRNMNNVDVSRGVPFENHQYPQPQCMPYNNGPPPLPRFHHNQQRRFESFERYRPPRLSRPWHQRRHQFRPHPPPPLPDYFYSPQQNNGDCVVPPFNNVQFPGDLENHGHEVDTFRRRHPYSAARRHSDPLYYDREERSPLLQLMLSQNYGGAHYFNNIDEEYVPEEPSISRVRRIRLASLETLLDSNSSSNNSLPDEEMDQQDKDFEDPEEGDVFEPLTSISPPDTEDTEECSRIVNAYLASFTKYVLVGKQKTELQASFGIWTGDENSNFAGVVPLIRPQCDKAALILAGAEGVKLLKGKGFSELNVSESGDYLVKNVTTWLSKANAENGFVISEIANWDEFKYAEEIGQLCRSLDGMKINWIQVPRTCEGIEQAAKLARAALPKDYVDENPAEDL